MDCGRLIACDHVATLLRQLAGVIRVRVPAVSEQLQSRLDNLPDVSWTPTDATTIELECRDVKATLLRVLAILSDLNLEILKLETQEPNLENLFLHLTGRALRD
jgi:ABC-2 type transport system ATP-binding protein